MQILKRDLKHNTLTIKPESKDDLWVLEKILKPSDLISGRTVRAIKILSGDKEVKEKKRIFVKLVAEKIEFSKSGSELRALGKIIEGEEHGYHTFEILINEVFTVERQEPWRKYELERLEKAKRKMPKILICVVDYSDASFAMLTERLEFLSSIEGVSGKSYGISDKKGFFTQVINFLREKECDNIILAGPGFAKDDILKLVRGEEIAKKIFVDSVSHTGEVGINEVLRRGIVEKIIKESAVSEQTRLIEEFFIEISKGGKVIYGLNEVKNAVELGAVSTLLINDKLIRENESLLDLAEKKKSDIKIIDSEHESGKRFLNFCGIGGFLRFRIA